MARIIDTQRKLLIQHGLLEDIKEAGEEYGSLTAALAAPDWTLLDRELSPLFKQVKFACFLGRKKFPNLPRQMNCPGFFRSYLATART